MDFNFDTGAIFGGLATLDVTTLAPLDSGPANVLTIIGNGALTLPKGTAAERPAAAGGTDIAGMFRYNTTTDTLEYFNSVLWSTLSVGGGTVTSVAATSSTAALTVTGSPITSSGTLTFDLDADLTAIAALSGTGISVRTGAGTWATRTITGTAGNITVADGDGVLGNPTLNLAAVTQAATGSFVKVTLDGFGRVTGNTAVVTADITALVDGTYVNVAGDTMTGNLVFTGGATVTGLPAPVAGSDAVNKDYADALANGLSWKTSVTVATTTNGTLATAFENGDVIDGVTLTTGMRILIKNQTTQSENGIYVVQASGAPVRATDMDSTTPINEINGAAVFTEQGTVNADTAWVQINDVTVLGTDPLAFVQFAGAGSYTAGNGLTLTGNQFSLTTPVSPANGGTGTSTAPSAGQFLYSNAGITYSPTTLSGVAVTTFSGGTTGLTPNTASSGAITLAGTLNIANGGTGLTTAPTNGQLLIGNGTGYSLNTVTPGTGILVTNGAGTITITSTGTGSSGTWVPYQARTNTQAIAQPNTGHVVWDNVTLSSATQIVVSADDQNGVDNSAYYDIIPVNTVMVIQDADVSTNFQRWLITSKTKTVASPNWYTFGVTLLTNGGVFNAINNNHPIAIEFQYNGGSFGTVTSVDVSGGSTGFTFSGGPVTTTGTITMAGTLGTTNGGTGLSTLGTSNQFLSVNPGATSLEYKTISAGTGISVTPGAGVLTITNTGVTSVALTAPSIFTVSGSPVTTTGTLDFALNTQADNTFFAGPSTGGPSAPTFRTITAADLGTALQLYKENPVTPVAPVASGSNAVAIGSGATASGVDSFADGRGSDARIYGQKAFANGAFTTAGDAQHGVYVLRNETTDNTLTELFLDGVAATQRIVMPNNSVFIFEILVVGRRTDATGGGAGYRFIGVARKDATAGSITFVGTPSKTIVGETNAGWDTAMSVDTTNGSFRVRVTGENAKTIRWVATVLTTEVTN